MTSRISDTRNQSGGNHDDCRISGRDCSDRLDRMGRVGTANAGKLSAANPRDEARQIAVNIAKLPCVSLNVGRLRSSGSCYMIRQARKIRQRI
jgi:hypothetical protein